MRVCAPILYTMALAVLFGACEYEEVGYLSDAEMTVGQDNVDATGTEDAGAEDAGDDPALLTGPGCEIDDDCDSGTCVTTALLESFGATGLEIPGGLCSLLLCAEDADCGAQATCIDGAPFGASGFQLCLPVCDEMFDCRWEEAWSCIAPIEEEPERYVCLPDNVIVALECDDGHCEEGSR